MAKRVLTLFAPIAFMFGGCAANPAAGTAAHAGAYGVECPCCFTIIEFVRSNPPAPGATERVQCQRCCETLTFTVSPGSGAGQLMLATSHWPEPVPVDLAAPIR
jgi:hypothetical protein